ncbi:MAG: M28 family peptidase [Bacteroidales bacterium]
MKTTLLSLFLLLFLACEPLRAQQEPLSYQLSADDLEAWVSHLASDEMRGRQNGSPEMAEAARWIEGKFREFDLKPVYPDQQLIRPYEIQTRSGRTLAERNVVGYLEGSDPALRKEYILVTAHFDHIGTTDPVDGDSICNGADDNAAGTCTLLGIARLFKENGLKPGRSIVFASVSGEELGMRGSGHLARNLPFPAELAYANLNFEMTGHSHDLGPGNYYMTGCSFSNLDETVQAFRTDPMHRLIDTIPQADRLFYMSDNIAFARLEREGDVSRGIPCGTFVTTVHGDHIHTPNDEPGLFDFENMASLVNYFGEMVLWLSHSTRSVDWTDPRFERIGPWEGQEPVKEVSTETVPVALQQVGEMDLGDGLHISNAFEGARMNGAVRMNDSLVSVAIAPENAPVNMSPWYAFQLWAAESREIWVRLTYPDDAWHRYDPRISTDGLHWQLLDTTRIRARRKVVEEEEVVAELSMKLTVGPDTLWVAAQELQTPVHLEAWIRGLERHAYVSRQVIGESREGRPIPMLRIGKGTTERMVMVISRQHPPEVTGFLAMQAFVETICGDTRLAREFRRKYTTYVVPMANPDGVAHGHWRHNMGGVDLNRDWKSFHQPETAAIRDAMNRLAEEEGGTFYFGVDFHSTFEDIYYTIGPEPEGNMPGLVPALIERSTRDLPGYVPNVKPRSPEEARVTSTSFLFDAMGAEALTYEVGDRTPREFVRSKAERTAGALMELMLE